MTEKKEEFWTSKEGILIRLEDLSHDFTFKVFNGAVRGYIKDAGFKKFGWVTSEDNIARGVSCEYCKRQNGKEYKVGQFLPKIPAHIGCDCFWDILIAL